jgi:hypothetical protein
VSGGTATCIRCGAPAAADHQRGGQLVRVKGIAADRRLTAHRSRGRRDAVHRDPFYVHADRAFCDRRIPRDRRRGGGLPC